MREGINLIIVAYAGKLLYFVEQIGNTEVKQSNTSVSSNGRTHTTEKQLLDLIFNWRTELEQWRNENSQYSSGDTIV